MTVDVREVKQVASEDDTGLQLEPHHLAHLVKSAIAPEFIRQRGYQTINDPKQLEAIGFKTSFSGHADSSI